MKLNFYTVNEKYTDYLRKFDHRVPYTFDVKAKRPFIGIVLHVNDHFYFAPLSSPKEKHLRMKNQIDFLKIKNGEYGAINFNNMIPIIQRESQKMNLEELSLSDEGDIKYKNLLANQLSWCNAHKDRILKIARKLYEFIVEDKVEYVISNRCCNFKLLEEKCLEYDFYLESMDEVAAVIERDEEEYEL